MAIDYNKKFKGLKFWFYIKTVYNLLIYEIGIMFIALVLLLKSYQKFSWITVFSCLLAYIVVLGISYLLYIIYNMYKSKSHLNHLPDTVQKSDIGKEITYFIKDSTSAYTWFNGLFSRLWVAFGLGILLIIVFTWGLEALKVGYVPASLYAKLLLLVLLCLILSIATRVVKRLCRA